MAYYGKPSRAIPLRALPGDVVLFSNTELVRQTIKLVQGSEWDHIGLVVPKYPPHTHPTRPATPRDTPPTRHPTRPTPHTPPHTHTHVGGH